MVQLHGFQLVTHLTSPRSSIAPPTKPSLSQNPNQLNRPMQKTQAKHTAISTAARGCFSILAILLHLQNPRREENSNRAHSVLCPVRPGPPALTSNLLSSPLRPRCNVEHTSHRVYLKSNKNNQRVQGPVLDPPPAPVSSIRADSVSRVGHSSPPAYLPLYLPTCLHATIFPSSSSSSSSSSNNNDHLDAVV